MSQRTRSLQTIVRFLTAPRFKTTAMALIKALRISKSCSRLSTWIQKHSSLSLIQWVKTIFRARLATAIAIRWIPRIYPQANTKAKTKPSSCIVCQAVSPRVAPISSLREKNLASFLNYFQHLSKSRKVNAQTTEISSSLTKTRLRVSRGSQATSVTTAARDPWCSAKPRDSVILLSISLPIKSLPASSKCPSESLRKSMGMNRRPTIWTKVKKKR